MLTIRPLAAALNPPAQVAAAVGRAAELLQRRRVAHRFTTGESDLADMLLVVTGGTERLALEATERAPGPVFLLAHPELNSLPAALEVLACLRQRGRSGRICLLGDGEDRSLSRLARHLEVRRRLHSLRLGRIGVPSAWLVASMPSAELVQATWGPGVVDVPMDEVFVAGCEGDVPAALTMLWLQLTTGQPGFMANPQAIDAAAGTLELAHCTIARRLVSRYALRSHFESSQGVAIAGEIPPGPVTVARVGGADLRGLFAAEGEVTASGDEENRCRTQVCVRLDADLGQLLARPLGNHLVLAPGHVAAELAEYHELFIAG